ncbi:MAG TPA: amidohydrolase [Bacillota bacterium]
MARSAVINIDRIVTGRLDEPFAEGDAVLVEDGRIAAVGYRNDLDLDGVDRVVDAAGAVLVPGLIDSHCHVVLGDYTPRQKTVDFLESYVHGGITRCISPSEVHAPGRPSDPAGVKALAVAAERCFRHFRPGGMTVHGGSVILEPGLTEEDFAELAGLGVWLAKAGFGAFARPRDCAPLVRWAQAHGFVVMCHTGGASIPGSSPVTAEDLLEMRPDVSGHTNGGPTAMSDDDVQAVIEQSDMYLQVVQAGNLRSALDIARRLAEAGRLERLLIASDTPTGTGMMPLGVLKSVVELASLAPLAPETALAAATGSVGRAYRLEAGVIEEGRPADLMLIDAPLGSHDRDGLDAIARGDIPAVACLFTSGELRFERSRNTPPPTRPVRVLR